MRPPVPILLLVRELTHGGCERNVGELGRALDAKQFSAHVGCFHPNGFRADELRAAGVPIVKFPVTSFKNRSAAAGAWQMLKYVKQHDIQIVHTFDTPMTVFGVPVARCAGVPVVIASQLGHRTLTPGMYTYLLRATDRLVDAIVVNCRALERHMQCSERVTPKKITLNYNGIDFDKFRLQERAVHPKLGNASLVIGVVCVLRPEKGLHTLIEAFAQACHGRADIKLFIVGSGPCLEELQRHAAAAGIWEQCVFEPSKGDVAAWMRFIDIYVLPSLSEGLAYALMEAMACGCCAVASDAGGNPELVHHGKTGLVFHRGSSDDLAQQLRALIQNASRRNEYASFGADYIRRHFSLERHTAKMQALYIELLARKRVGAFAQEVLPSATNTAMPMSFHD